MGISDCWIFDQCVRRKSEDVKLRGQHFRTIWLKLEDPSVVQLIDQRFLPHQFVIEEVRTLKQMATAIRDMHVRGAGLIGVSAGYGMYLAALEAAERGSFDEHVQSSNAIESDKTDGGESLLGSCASAGDDRTRKH